MSFSNKIADGLEGFDPPFTDYFSSIVFFNKLLHNSVKTCKSHNCMFIVGTATLIQILVFPKTSKICNLGN